MTDLSIRFKLRRGTAANLASVNETPLAGELVVETNTGKAKLGDGTTAYNALPYWTAGGAVAGAITGSGLTMATARLLGRTTAGTGAVEEIAAGPGALLSGGVLNTTGSTLNTYGASTGDILLNALTASTLTTVNTTADRLDFYPLVPLANDLTISALAIYVVTGIAGALCRVGIYADNNGKPDGGALLFDSGALDCATSATARESAVSLTLSKSSRYWLAVLANNTQTLRGIPSASLMMLPRSSDLSSTTAINLRRATLTYGALPSTAPSTVFSSTVHVAIGLKYA